jgi:hypothetical protein
MTTTIQELSTSSEFWKCRCDEQLAYIAKYKSASHTRPDHESVLASANYILEKCNAMLVHAVQVDEPKVGW